MGILAHEHIQTALNLGLVKIKDHLDVGGYSIDLPIGHHLERPSTGERIRIPDDGLIMTPRDYYLWKLPSDLELAMGLIGEVRTRSSYARLGICTTSDCSNDDLNRYTAARRFTLTCSLYTYGTNVRIRPNEPIGQLVLKTDPMMYFKDNMKELMRSGDLVVQEGNKRLSPEQARFQGGLELMMDNIIYAYNPDSILDPKGVKEGDFRRIDLENGGCFLEFGTFFISSCIQQIATSNRYISYVTPYVNSASWTQCSLDHLGSISSILFKTHPNAPYHAFGLDALRQITFENLVTHPKGIHLQPGCKQAELFVYPLLGPSNHNIPSRYHGQNGATLMRT